MHARAGFARSFRGLGFALTVALGAAAGCHRGSGQGSEQGAGTGGATSAESAEHAPRVPFDVRADGADVTFFWFDEHGAAHAASRVDDVPQAHRDVVRVDPNRPELRAPGWVYLADLRTPGADGRFPARAVASEQFANELAARSGLAAAMAAPPPAPPTTGATAGVLAPSGLTGGDGGAGSAQGRVVIYGASWCGACHQAAAWMRANGIPFIEHDIEAEPAAAQEMMTLARAQGVPTGSIPIINVRGRLLVGFSPDALQQALRGT